MQKTVGFTGACGGDDDRTEIFVFGLCRLNQLGHVGKHPLFGDGSNSTVIQHLLEHFVQLVTDHLTAFGFREEVCDVVCGQVFIQETELDGVIVVHEVVDIGGGVGKSVDSAEVQVIHGDRAVFVKNNFKADFLAHALDDGLCSLAVCAADPFPGQIRKGIDFFIRLGDDHALGIAVVGDGVIVLFDTLRLHGPAVCGDVSTTGVEHAPDGVKGGLLQLNLPAGALSNLGPHLGINTGPGAVIVQKTVGFTGACGGDDDRTKIFRCALCKCTAAKYSSEDGDDHEKG